MKQSTPPKETLVAENESPILPTQKSNNTITTNLTSYTAAVATTVLPTTPEANPISNASLSSSVAFETNSVPLNPTTPISVKAEVVDEAPLPSSVRAVPLSADEVTAIEND